MAKLTRIRIAQIERLAPRPPQNIELYWVIVYGHPFNGVNRRDWRFEDDGGIRIVIAEIFDPPLTTFAAANEEHRARAKAGLVRLLPDNLDIAAATHWRLTCPDEWAAAGWNESNVDEWISLTTKLAGPPGSGLSTDAGVEKGATK